MIFLDFVLIKMFQLRRFPGILYKCRYKLYSVLIIFTTIIYILFKWNVFCVNLQAWQHVKQMVSSGYKYLSTALVYKKQIYIYMCEKIYCLYFYNLLIIFYVYLFCTFNYYLFILTWIIVISKKFFIKIFSFGQIFTLLYNKKHNKVVYIVFLLLIQVEQIYRVANI